MGGETSGPAKKKGADIHVLRCLNPACRDVRFEPSPR